MGELTTTRGVKKQMEADIQTDVLVIVRVDSFVE